MKNIIKIVSLLIISLMLNACSTTTARTNKAEEEKIIAKKIKDAKNADAKNQDENLPKKLTKAKETEPQPIKSILTLETVYDNLNLTEEQKDRIAAIKEAGTLNSAAIRKKYAKATSDSVLSDMQDELMNNRIHVNNLILEALEPQQIEKLKETATNLRPDRRDLDKITKIIM